MIRVLRLGLAYNYKIADDLEWILSNISLLITQI